MANPRQRSKAKSHRSTKPNLNQKRRLHQKLRKAPPLKGPEVLQDGWDKRKTVFQNYAALGLLPSIPIPHGASSSRSHRAEIQLPNGSTRSSSKAGQSSSSGQDAEAEAHIPISYGRIIRDEEGNVVDIILEEDEKVEEDEEMQEDGDGDEGEGHVRRVEAKTEVVKSLEALSSASQPVIRHSSTSEREWLRQLVAAHGDDTEAMARDRKLNVWQKTKGELGRMIKKAGGVGKLRG